MAIVRRYGPYVLTIWILVVFVPSLFSKFSGAPEAVYIFTTIDRWASERLGLDNLFGPGELLGPMTIGILEALASILLFVGAALTFAPRTRDLGARLHRDGVVLTLAVISGALFFHLFTPLGIDVGDPDQGVPKDGGTLFAMAVSVFLSALLMLWMHHRGMWPEGVSEAD